MINKLKINQKKSLCFTATGSFVAAGLLAVIGFLTLRETKKRSLVLFASMPFLFALQQLSEGILWITIADKQYSTINSITTYAFLVFALVIWPLWVPLSLWLPEKNILRKKLLLLFIGYGFFGSIYSIYVLFYCGISSQVASSSIRYNIFFGNSFRIKYDLFFYMISVIIPFFISSISLGNIMGTAIALSFVATYYFMNINLISVWCFFSALISVIILFIVQLEEKR